MICAFFGHKDCGQEIEQKLYETIVNLILEHNVNKFYVGNNGKFDYMVIRNLRKLKELYPYIDYSVVLAYRPTPNNTRNIEWFESIYPEEFSNFPLRLAISKRNCWLIEKCDIVVTYVHHSLGNSYQFKELAERKKKWVINIEK